MNQTTDWASALAILAAGVILGLVIVYFVSRRRAPAVATNNAVRDLEARRDSLIEQLRGEVSPGERTRLELETARVLRALDEQGVSARVSATDEDQSMDARLRRATLTGFAYGAGSVVVLAALGYFVMKAAGPRQDAQPAAQQQPQQQPQQGADPVVAGLEAAVRNAPDDLDARINLAQALLERDNLMGVFEQTQYVLTKQPQHSRALTYQALVRMAMGQQSEALQMLQYATRVDPMLLDAWVALAWAHTQNGNMQEAEKAMAEAMRRRPDEKQRLEQVLAQMRSHPPVPSAPAAGPSVRITLEVDPAVRSRAGVVFVIARAEGVAAGPPVAVKRIEASTLPLTVELTSADSMMGQPLPARLRIEARLDSDGNAMTKTGSEPSAVQDGVTAGSAVRLALR